MLTYLTTFLKGGDHAKYIRKADLQKMEVNTTKIRKVCRTEINFVLGKNGGHKPSSLGDRLIVVVRQAGRWAGRQAGRP